MLIFPRTIRDDISVVIVVPQYMGKWFFVRRHGSIDFLFPRGELDRGEDALAAAKRVLSHDSGAIEAELWPVTYFGIVGQDSAMYGQIFYANISKFGGRPDEGIAERCLLNVLPREISHSEMDLQIMEHVEIWQISNRSLLYCISAGGVEAGGILDTMEGQHLDGIYCSTDEQLTSILKPLARERRLEIIQNPDLGPEGMRIFRNGGVVLFEEILSAQSGLSLVLGLDDGLLKAIHTKYNEFIHPYDSPHLWRYEDDYAADTTGIPKQYGKPDPEVALESDGVSEDELPDSQIDAAKDEGRGGIWAPGGFEADTVRTQIPFEVTRRTYTFDRNRGMYSYDMNREAGSDAAGTLLLSFIGSSLIGVRESWKKDTLMRDSWMDES